MYDVRSKCGAPTAIEIEKVGIGVTRRRIIRVRKVETWIYDLGRTRFIQILRFERGKLIKITHEKH